MRPSTGDCIHSMLPERTLTDDEVKKVQQQILDRLSKELGATLR